MEEYRVIEGYEKYSVSNYGNVKNNLNDMMLYLLPTRRGNIRTTLYNENGGKIFLIHTLVAKAFIDNPTNKSIVEHIDGNKENNNVNNLRYA